MGQRVNDANFDAEVLSAREPVLVDFWAEWCAPCKAMDPILDQLGEELAGKVKIVKLDVDNNPSTTVKYNVRAMPTLIVFKDGEPVDYKVGAGHIDWPAIARALAASGYHGPIVLEPFRRDDEAAGVTLAQWRAPTRDEDAELKASIDYLKATLAFADRLAATKGIA